MISRAQEWEALLRERMLPYWQTMVSARGGYQVYDPGERSWRAQLKSMIKGSQNESVRGLVSQARLLWVWLR